MRGKAQTGSDRSSVTTDGVSCKAFPRGPLGRRNRATETVDSGLIAGPHRRLERMGRRGPRAVRGSRRCCSGVPHRAAVTNSACAISGLVKPSVPISTTRRSLAARASSPLIASRRAHALAAISCSRGHGERGGTTTTGEVHTRREGLSGGAPLSRAPPRGSEVELHLAVACTRPAAAESWL